MNDYDHAFDSKLYFVPDDYFDDEPFEYESEAFDESLLSLSEGEIDNDLWSEEDSDDDGEEDGYVDLCPEYDVASQGQTVEEARQNLVEALTLFFECADPAELNQRFKSELLVTQVEVRVA